MSIVAVYDPKTKRIVEKLHAYPSYRSSKGVTLAPKNAKEEAQLERIEENGRQIDKLNKEIEELDEQIALQSMMEADRLREKRRKLAEIIQQKENYNHAVTKIYELRTKMADMETLTLRVAVSGGYEECEISMNEYTGGGLSRLGKRLDDLSKTFLSDEPEFVKNIMQRQVRMEEELAELLEQARGNFLRHLTRMELADGVVQALDKAGWNIRVEDTGSLDRAVRVTVMTAEGACGELLFQPDEQIRLNTPGFSEAERDLLQRKILSALKASGASDVEHKCLDKQNTASEQVKTGKTQSAQAQNRERKVL